jgi:hypothetical protein
MKSWYSQLRKPEQGLNFSFEVKESLPVKDFQHQEEGTTQKEWTRTEKWKQTEQTKVTVSHLFRDHQR